MRIPQQFIDDVLARTDIVEVIGARLPLKKRGMNYIACCPFHTEKTPSFTVSASKQIYHCFGCGVGGNVISFLRDYDKLHFVEALEQLAAPLGLTLPRELAQHSSSEQHRSLYQVLIKAMRYYQQQLRQSPSAINYLKQRGLVGNTAKTFALGYAPPGWDGLVRALGEQRSLLEATGMLIKKKQGGYYDRFRDRIMFPIRDASGRVIAFGGRSVAEREDTGPKYLNSPETPLFHKSKALYGLYEMLQQDRHPQSIWVVEGYLDVVSLHQRGIHTVVATLGTATTGEHVNQLFRYTNEILFCFDGDQAGMTAAWRAFKACLPYLRGDRKVSFFLMPEGHDPDSLIQAIGTSAFKQKVTMEAQPFSEFLFAYCKQHSALHSLEGKAKFASLASESIRQLPAGTLQTMLWQQLADIVGLDSNSLQKAVTIESSQRSFARSQADQTKLDRMELTKLPLTRVAIMLLLQFPELITTLEGWEEIQQLDIPGMKILRELVGLLQRNPNLTTQALLSYWQDRPQAKVLAQLAIQELPYDQAGIQKEFSDLCKKMRQLYYSQEIDKLLKRASNRHLTQDEKIALQKLIRLNQGVDK